MIIKYYLSEAAEDEEEVTEEPQPPQEEEPTPEEPAEEDTTGGEDYGAEEATEENTEKVVSDWVKIKTIFNKFIDLKDQLSDRNYYKYEVQIEQANKARTYLKVVINNYSAYSGKIDQIITQFENTLKSIINEIKLLK